MMISPNGYVEEHVNDTFEEMIEERKRLVDTINQLEEIAYDEDHSDPQWQFCPGPDVQYQMTLEYLSELCNLLKEKYNKEIVWGEE